MTKNEKKDEAVQANDLAAKLARRKARRDGNNAGMQAEYESLDGTIILRLIDVISELGGTCTFATTRDGGAFRIATWVNGETEVTYIRPTENPDERIAFLLESWYLD